MKFLIFLLFLNYLFANNEFIVSYKAIVKNQILIGEEYNVSKALTLSKNYTVIGICNFIPKDEVLTTDELLQILKNNKDDVLSCLEKHTNAKIRDDAKFINNALNSKIKFEFKPQRILMLFDGNNVNIKIIEDIK